MAYYLKNGSVIAVARYVVTFVRWRRTHSDPSYQFASMQRDPIVSKASELLRLGLMPSAAEIKGGKVRSIVL